jgi:MSHA pilin protein MshA
MNRKGFTLIELILVIAILGILAVSALPKFLNLSTQANQAARDGVVGAVRSGIALYRANNLVNGGTGAAPASLSANFTEVLDSPVTGWTGSNPFTHTATSSSYTYNATNGTFQ